MLFFKKLALILVATLPLGNGSPVAYTNAANAILGKYIVTLKDGISTNDFNTHVNWVRIVHEHSLGRRQLGYAGVEKTYSVGNFNAYAGHFDDETLERIKSSADVADIEQQALFYPHGWAVQKNVTHGLATISHREPGSNEYVYDESAGAGTTVYVIDSGIQLDHPEFEGRATHGFNAMQTVPDDDVMGHGTHVAGVVGSKTFGVAKKTKLVSVKIFHESGSTTQIILDAIEWTIKDITAKAIQNRAVINMSFGGADSTATNKMIKVAYGAGILCVIAAGNEGKDANLSSPANSPHGITVAAVDLNWRLWKHSNYGSVVHILAAGEDVLSLFPTNRTLLANGTSQAAPHVAGLAAYLIAAEKPNSTKELKDRIISLGTSGKAINIPPGTVNLVAFNGRGDQINYRPNQKEVSMA